MFEQLSLISTLMTGLFAGSLLTEAMILVPYWRRMDVAEFDRLHATLGPNLFRYFAPLTTLAVVLAVIVATIAGKDNIAWLISAGLCLTALAIFFIYFRAANNRFASRSIKPEDIPAELARWSNWHWFRTVLVVVAFAASIQGHVGV